MAADMQESSSFASPVAQLATEPEAAALTPGDWRATKELSREGSSRASRAGYKSAGAGSKGVDRQRAESAPAGKIMEKEERATGRVELRMYTVSYVPSCLATACHSGQQPEQ